MARKTWILTDVDADASQEQLSLGPAQVGGIARGYSVTKRTLHGGLREGVEIVEVQKRPTRLRGRANARHGPVACIVRQCRTRLEVAGPRSSPSGIRVSVLKPSGLGWLSGFDELLVRCGLEWNGGPDLAPMESSNILCTAVWPISLLIRCRFRLTGTPEKSRFRARSTRRACTVTNFALRQRSARMSAPMR